MVKVCFVLLLEQGHLTILASIGKYLLARDPNNEILFITDDEFEPAIKKQCSKFQTILFKQPDGVQEKHKARLDNKLDKWKMDRKELFKLSVRNFTSMIDLWKSRQFIVKDLVESIENLDFLFIENLFNLPFLMNIKVKWGLIISTNPLRISDQVNYPPMSSGTCDMEEAKEYLEIFKQNSGEFFKSLDEWYEEFGLKRIPSLSYVQGSDYLNVYLFPRAIGYFRPEDIKPGRWFELQTSVVSKEVENKVKDFVDQSTKLSGKELLTETFLNKPGKLILFSLGTILTRTLEIFRDLFIPLLKNIPHKFVVCKGKFGDQVELPDNCVGANMINQLELLPLVDLFITHAGNNSFTEAFYYGVPMVVIPGFGDQHDNAARLEYFDLGKRLHIGSLTKENLESAINYVLNNDKIKKKMIEISEEIRNGKDGLEEICDLIYKECDK